MPNRKLREVKIWFLMSAARYQASVRKKPLMI